MLNEEADMNREHQKLMTGAQRKAVESRIQIKVQRLFRGIESTIDAEKEPAFIVKARKLINRYEEAQQKRKDGQIAQVARVANELRRNLPFDTVESCLRQLEDFESMDEHAP